MSGLEIMPRHGPKCRCCAAVWRLALPSPGQRLAGSRSLGQISGIFNCSPSRKQPELSEGGSSLLGLLGQARTVTWNHGFVERFGLRVTLKATQFQPRESCVICCDLMPPWRVSTDGSLNSPFLGGELSIFWTRREWLQWAVLSPSASSISQEWMLLWLPANPALWLSVLLGFGGFLAGRGGCDLLWGGGTHSSCNPQVWKAAWDVPGAACSQPVWAEPCRWAQGTGWGAQPHPAQPWLQLIFSSFHPAPLEHLSSTSCCCQQLSPTHIQTSAPWSHPGVFPKEL